MGLYKLTAKRKGARASVCRFVANDDKDALVISAFKVMQKANAEYKAGLTNGAWWKGEITLTDSEGRVVRTMPAKEKAATPA